MHPTRATRLASTALRFGINPTPITGMNPLQPALKAILPPLALYRRVLRAHRRHLPSELRVLGDGYVKNEFRAHQNVENPAQVVSCFPAVIFSVKGDTGGDMRRGTRG